MYNVKLLIDKKAYKVIIQTLVAVSKLSNDTGLNL